MVHSFDVFDTVLTRSVAFPKDVFLWMENHLKQVDNLGIPHKLSSNFSKFRRKAEAVARWHYKKEDIQLKEIYQILALKFRLNNEIVNRLMSLEMDTEFALIQPIEPVCQEIRTLLSEHQKVIFISDTYLSSEFINSIFFKFNIIVSKKDIFTSGDIGVRKITGRLYKHILNSLSLKPKEIIHFGDNIISDLYVPKFLGISVREGKSNG